MVMCNPASLVLNNFIFFASPPLPTGPQRRPMDKDKMEGMKR
jgi:hypothetical protein